MCECGSNAFEILMKSFGYVGSQWFLDKYHDMDKKELGKTAGKDVLFFIFANGLYEIIIYPFIERMIEKHNLKMYGENKPKYCMCRLYRNIIIGILQTIYSLATKEDNSTILKDLLSILNADIMTGMIDSSSYTAEDCECDNMHHDKCHCKHKGVDIKEIIDSEPILTMKAIQGY